MPSCGSTVSTNDVSCWKENKGPFTISTGKLDFDAGTDLDNFIFKKTLVRSKSCSLIHAHTKPEDKNSQISTSQVLGRKIIVTQPLSWNDDLSTGHYTKSKKMSNLFEDDTFLADTGRQQTYPQRASISDLATRGFRYRCYSEDFGDLHATLDDFISSNNRASSKTWSLSQQVVADDLVIIDGQIAVKDSNVDPILCRLRRQQVIAGTRRKESSIATDMLEAERVRFDRNIAVKQFDEESRNETDNWLEICCCCCNRQENYTMKELGPSDSILVTGSSKKKHSPKGDTRKARGPQRQKSTSI